MTNESSAREAFQSGLTEIETRPLKGARRVAARRLSESWRSIVPVTLHRFLDVGRALADDRRGGHLVDVLLHRTAQALVAQPELNAVLERDLHRLFAQVNIGYAVDTPRGLVVPVLRDVQLKSVPEVADARRVATALVMDWRQSPADLVEGTFTVTNLGPFDVEFFTPIINAPQVAILGIGRLRYEPLGIGHDSDRPRAMLPVSLTIDHRVLTGADGARFLQTLQHLLEQ